MEKNFYMLLSYIFHPIFIPLYIVGICFTANIYPIYFLNNEQKLLLLLMIVLNTLVLPIIGVVLMKRYGIISSYHIEERKERFYPYLYFFTLYVLTAVMLLLNTIAPIILSYVYFVAAGLIFLLVLFNSRIKVSAHTSSIISFATMLIMLDIKGVLNMDMAVVIAIVLSGLIGTARLALKAHSTKEVALGYVLGTGVTLLSSYLILF
jgi:hypothetical protein